MTIRIVVLLIIAIIVTACAGMKNDEKSMAMDDKMAKKMASPKDGDLALPKGYENWPLFIAHIEKEKNKQIRDIYINTQGNQLQKGDEFPNGTQFVMALYSAKKNADGSLLTAADGKLVKDTLSKVFIMEKGVGWGKQAPVGLKNGDWVYAAYNADGSKAEVNYSACRGCHLPHSATDYVFHYEQYFDN